MAKAVAVSTTSRRALLNSMAAIPVGGALVAPVAAQDPHVEWLITIEECWRLMDDDGTLDPEMARLWNKVEECQDLITDTPAHTWDGVVAQIRVGHYAVDCLALRETGMAALDNALAAIRTLAGRA